MQILIRVVPALLLGVAAAVLVSCGSSGVGLIPAASAGPLQNDFEAVAQAAESGNGSCVATESALGKTEQDFLALPQTVDAGLHARLDKGIANLRKRALEMCAEPAPGATTAETTTTTTTTTSTPPPTDTNTQTTPTTTEPTTPTSTQTTPTSTTPPNQNGGTAPGEGSGENGAGVGGAQEGANGEGSNAGGASPGGGQ